MSRGGIRLQRFVSVLAVASAVVILVAGIGLRLTGTQFQTVTSGSMEPSIHPGDIALTRPVAVTSLAVGDVIAFYPPNDPQPRLHRITSITVRDGVVAVTTRGDANGAEDPWLAQLRGPTAYRLVGVMPLVGWVAQYRGLLLLAAGLLLALALGRDLWKEVANRRSRVSI